MGKCVGLMFAKISVNATDSHVHLSHLPSVSLRLLPINSDCASATAVRLNEFRTLYEHAARTTTRIYENAVFDTKRKSLLRHISTEKGLK